MRRFIPFVLLLISLASYGENVVTDAQGVKYTMNSDGTTCNVSGYTDACSGAIVIPSTIEGKTVVAVNDYALAYSTQITSIVLPNSVRIIGEGAFMDDGTRSSTLESVTLPEGLEVIEGFAFEHCINLTTCNIPSTVEFIRQNAFFDVSLSNVTLPRSLKCLENQSFFVDGDVTFTCESPTPPEIDPQSFTDGLGFKGNYSLIVPKGCRDAYYNQSAWSSQFGSISESNTSVDPFPEPYTDAQGVEYTLIGSGDYQGTYFVSGHTNTCSGAVTIPATINGKTVSYIGHGAFKSLSGLTSVTIENGINSIRSNAFSGCSNLSSVVLPNSLTQIGNNSFANCCKLASVIIPSSVVRVDAHAFGSCEKLTSATLECNVSSLWTQVFNGCQDANFYLTTLTVSTVTPEVVARDVFYYLGSSKISNMTLIVPVGSISAYKAADYWKEFKSIQDTEGNTEDASVTSATINVATAGTLSTLISEANKNTITTLTLTGSLNGDDFRFIREMAGSDYNGVPTDGNLSTLDLSGATIVAGGSYVEIQDKKVYWNKEKTSYTSSSSVVDGEKVSEANKIGAYLFAGCQKLQTITLPNNITAIDDFGFWATGLTAITMPNTVTSIGFDAFFACWYLASVTIPSSVTSINDSFLFCSSLESIIVDSKNSIYDSRDNCNALIETSSNTLLVGCKNTTIPNGIIIIGSAAFANLNLTSITIPNSVTTIGNNAFGHNKLTSITIPSSVTSIANYAFQDNALQTVTVENPTPVVIYENTFTDRSNIDLIVPEGCSAAYKAVDYWKDFKSIKDTKGNSDDPVVEATINVETAGTLSTLISDANKNTIRTLTLTGSLNGDDFRFIREMAGSDYHGVPTDGNLATLDLSGATIVAGGVYLDIHNERINLTGGYSEGHTNGERTSKANTIGEYLLAGCQKLQSIILPNTVTKIEGFAFLYTGLTSIMMPSSLISIDQNGLAHCRDLASIIIPENVTTIDRGAFQWCTSLTSITIPASVTSLGSSLFQGCTNLESIVVESANTVYDSRNDCNAIIEKSSKKLIAGCKNSVIPNDVTAIGESAFFVCEGLTEITIPSGVTTIGNYAFSYCNSLATVTVLNPTPVVIKENTFSNRANATLYVPSGCKAAYEAADYWKEFKEIIAQAEKDDVVYTPNNEDHTVTVSDGGESSSEIVIQSSISINGQSYEVTAIGDCAFQNNELVVKVTIPETITSIGAKAFAGCKNLKSISIYVKVPINLSGAAASRTRGDGGSSVFAGVDTETCVLYVPAGSGDAYRNADGWKEFTNIVEMASSASIKVAKGMTTYTSEYNLDFSSLGDDVKAYVATGYDYDKNTIWLTRVKDVPAGTPILVQAPASETPYDIPVKASSGCYYKNMLVGNLSGGEITLSATTGDMTNYYLSNGKFLTATGTNTIGNGKAYLQIPTTPPAANVGSSQSVKLNDYGFASFCGSQDLDFTDVEGLKAFAVTGYDDANGTIWLTRVKRVSARTPLLLKGGSGASYTIPSVAVGSYYANMMKGNLSGSTITIFTTTYTSDGDMTNYYLKGNQLLKATDGGNTIGNGKAYMQIPSKHVTRSIEDIVTDLLIYGISDDEPEVISIPVARGINGDGTTNIREKLAPEQTNDVYYNLQGQRVDKPTKGLYIKNGKKVVIK